MASGAPTQLNIIQQKDTCVHGQYIYISIAHGRVPCYHNYVLLQLDILMVQVQ